MSYELIKKEKRDKLISKINFIKDNYYVILKIKKTAE